MSAKYSSFTFGKLRGFFAGFTQSKFLTSHLNGLAAFICKEAPLLFLVTCHQRETSNCLGSSNRCCFPARILSFFSRSLFKITDLKGKRADAVSPSRHFECATYNLGVRNLFEENVSQDLFSITQPGVGDAWSFKGERKERGTESESERGGDFCQELCNCSCYVYICKQTTAN